MLINKKSIHLLLCFMLISGFWACKKDKTVIKGIFPKKINNYKKQEELTENNQKKLSISTSFNENEQLIEKIEAIYNQNNKIIRYKYKSDIYAFSEFSIAKDKNYLEYKDNPLTYIFDNQLVLLSNNYIYVISKKIINLKTLNIKPQTKIKIPKNKLLNNIEQLFINDDGTFPFFGKYIKRESQYKDIIIHTIEPYQSKETKKLEDFISKQEILENDDNFTIFKIKDDKETFLYNKKIKMLFLNFNQDELEKIKNFVFPQNINENTKEK